MNLSFFLISALLLAGFTGCATLPADTGINTGSLSTGLYEVDSFDVYNANGRIHVLVGGKAAKDDKAGALRYLVSEDAGQHWHLPLPVGNNPLQILAVRGNDVQLAAQDGYLLALWQTRGELPGMGPLQTAYSEDGGKTWRSGGNPANHDQGDQAHADLFADGKGHFHAVWLEDPEENGYQSLRHAGFEAGGKWARPQTLDDSTCSCCWNTLALSADDTLNILYRDMKPRDMALMQSRDGGNKWQRTSTVGTFGWQFDGCPHTGGALAASGTDNNNLHSLVWTGLEGKQGLYYLHSSDNGHSWSNPARMGEGAMHGDIAAIDTDRVVAVWDEMGAEGSRIALAASVDGGKNWGNALGLTQAAINASHPRIVSTGRGYLALWTEKAPGQPRRLVWRSGQ